MKPSIVLTIGIFALNLSCQDSEEDRRSDFSSRSKRSSNGTNLGLTSFEEDILPILKGNCVSCHNSATANAKPLPSSNFATFEAARPYGSLMPLFPPFADLATADQNIIEDWVDNGLTEADYGVAVADVLEENCVSCHNQEAAEREPMPKTDYNKYETARKYGALMPSFPPFEKLSNDEQQLIEQWVLDGVPK